MKNLRLMERNASQQRKVEEDMSQLRLDYQKEEESKEKRLRLFYKKQYKEWQNMKSSNHDQFENLTQRKRMEDDSRRKRANEMIVKLQRSKKAVDAFMQDKEHKQMLSQELRKLQQEDISTLRERVQRLEERKKKTILEKERHDKSLSQEVSKKLMKLVDQRYKHRIQMLMEKENY